MKSLPYKHKIVIGGNHDFGLDNRKKAYQKNFDYFGLKESERVDCSAEIQKLKEVCTYLEHDYVEIEGIRIFASPYIESTYVQGFYVNPYEGEQLWSQLP